jgi:hypothetical protein
MGNIAKRRIAAAALCLAALPLASCGNKDYGWGNYSFTKVHILDGGATSGRCVAIVSWHDDDVGIEVRTVDFGTLYLSEGTYILIEGKCPICDAD